MSLFGVTVAVSYNPWDGARSLQSCNAEEDILDRLHDPWALGGYRAPAVVGRRCHYPYRLHCVVDRLPQRLVLVTKRLPAWPATGRVAARFGRFLGQLNDTGSLDLWYDCPPQRCTFTGVPIHGVPRRRPVVQGIVLSRRLSAVVSGTLALMVGWAVLQSTIGTGPVSR